MAALCAAGALWAGPAAAAQMLATIAGDFNDDPVWGGWQVQIRYDSDLGTTTISPGDLGVLQWDASSGTPSPVLSVTGFVTPLGGPGAPPTYDFSFTDATSVTFQRGTDFDHFYVAGADWFVDLGDLHFFGPDHPTDFRFDTPWSRQIMEYGAWDIDLATGLPHAHGLADVQRLAAPEPATWGLMIVGFGLAGAALRRRRAVLAG
jgi:hypothetical protein